MKSKIFLTLFLLLFSLTFADAQLSDNFSDGDFTNNPVWVGNASDWIVNPSFQLQSNNTVANSTFYISTSNTLAISVQWELFVNLKFATSGANYVDAFLTASSSDLTSASGYFVRIGNTKDEICLYKTGSTSPIIDGADGVVASSSNNLIKIKVIRTSGSQWTLYSDMTGTGNNYINEGSIVDSTFTSSAFFGFLVKQSSVSSFAQKHFFDDIIIKPYIPDITAPEIIAASATSNNSLDILFNEPLDNVSSEVTSNFSIDNNIGQPISATLDGFNKSLVHLSFTNNFISGTHYAVSISGVADVSGNTIVHAQTNFIYYVAQQYDIVIDEIMSDPDPVVGLPPDKEWIELKNVSDYPINISGWHIDDEITTSGGMPDFILEPDSFVLACAGSSVVDMSKYGKIIPVTNFPSLNNGGKVLVLRNAAGRIIHVVNYSSAWYQNTIKANGGWTLEMIDTKNPCSGITNWKASIDPKGGTPGHKNSVDEGNPDQTPPKVINAFTAGDSVVVLIFSEPMDSLKCSQTDNYQISDGIGKPLSASPLGPLFNKVLLKLNSSLNVNKIYNVGVSSVTDCSGNSINTGSEIRVGKSDFPKRFDIVVNEVLFNPPPTGTDYIEIYNRSNKIINLKDVYVANRNATGQIDNKTIVATEDQLFFPGDFLVLTKDPDIVKANYITQNPDAFITIPGLPSMNDAEGCVVLMNISEEIIDEVGYSEKWHFKLIDNFEGVALERISYNDTTLVKANQEHNWHSAAKDVGYGTPGYKNSQYRINEDVSGQIAVSPEIISPDNDGYDDYANIDYSFPDIGYVANITIFDAAGRPVRFLQRNALCGMKGVFRWDGLGDKGQQLPIGIYIIYSEFFNLEGKKKQFKKTIVLARRN